MKDGVKTIPESEIMSLIMKFNKGIEELLSLQPSNVKALREREIISKYIPKALSEEEIREFIKNRISLGENNMSTIMAAFKSNYSGQYDGKLVSVIVKEMLV
jgi:Glu-tRNA(Gln) amidotransferase subunit E-like FAD-binding protein